MTEKYARPRGAAFRTLLASVMALAAVSGGSAAAEMPLAAYMQAFYESALWNDGKVPLSVRKWTTPIRVRMTGPMVGSYSDMVLERLRALAAIAGIDVTVIDPAASNENFLVEFVETNELFVGGRAAGCVSYNEANATGEMTHARLVINLNQGFDLRRCITHESMHALGFPGHPQASDSVLSYVYNREDATDIDKISLRTLYDKRLTPGFLQLPAMAVTADVIVDKLVAAHLLAEGQADRARGDAHRFVTKLVPVMISLAEQGDVGLQVQLGIAYTLGQVVDKDEAKGFAWFKRASESTAPEWRASATDGIYLVGYALVAGRGMPANPAEGIEYYKRAAARGHIAAQNNLGVAYRNGIGVERDPVEAYKWLALAAGKNLALARKNLDALAPTLTAEQRDEAQRRVAAWVAKP